MTIKIYKPSKTAMQSGKGKTKKWLAEFISNTDNVKDTLMGWNSSYDTQTQIKIYFNTKDEAVEWAKSNNYQYFVENHNIKKIKPKSYASNFDFKKKEPWTH